MGRQEERALDRALGGKGAPDADLAPLVETGERLRGAFDVPVSTRSAERAMFVQAIGARRHPLGWMRMLAPISVTAAAAIVILLLGRNALPGQTFYPVREVLRSVGLAPASLDEIDGWLEQATTLLDRAEDTYGANETQAERLAVEAVKLLGAAEELIDEVDSEQQTRREDRIQSLLLRAEALLTTGPVGAEDDGDGSGGGDDVVGRRDDDGDEDEGPDDDGPDDDNEGENDDGSRAGSNEGPNNDTGDDDGPDGNNDDDGSGSNSGPGGDGSGSGDDDTNDTNDEDDGGNLGGGGDDDDDDTNDDLGDDEEGDEEDG